MVLSKLDHKDYFVLQKRVKIVPRRAPEYTVLHYVPTSHFPILVEPMVQVYISAKLYSSFSQLRVLRPIFPELFATKWQFYRQLNSFFPHRFSFRPLFSKNNWRNNFELNLFHMLEHIRAKIAPLFGAWLI